VSVPEQIPAAPPLARLYLYVTAGCNLACRHCWLAPRLDPQGTASAMLSVELAEAIIEEARPLGLSGVKLTGGEPLLHPRIAELLGAVRRAGLRLSLETNATRCTPELAGEIAAGKAFVSVSLDGVDADTHEWVRGIPGCFELALQGLRNLVAAGLRPQIIMTVMRHNARQVEAMVGFAEALGAGSVKYNILQPTARGERLHEAGDALSIAELIALGRRVEMELSRSTPLQLFFDVPPAFCALSRLASNDGCGVCGVKGILGVLPGGQYALCGIGEAVPELVFGMAGQQSLRELWSGHPVLLALREGLPGRLSGICQRCLMRGRCLGTCVAQNFYRHGDLFAPFWFCEMAEEEGLFPATRRA
jgi:SynChlorMet cassette radical SAM/SPASM protein ScmF